MSFTYASREYMQALAGQQAILHLEDLGVWVERRAIPGSPGFDTRAAYPFTRIDCPDTLDACRSSLAMQGVVSLVLVSDALQTEINYEAIGFDYIRRYKAHHLINRKKGTVAFSKHHRYEIRKALKRCEVEVISLADHFDQWCLLYKHLTMKHKFSSAFQFSKEYFRYLAETPEFVALAAKKDGEVISCHIMLHEGPYVYSHLAASSAEGYQCSASYALIDFAMEYFCDVEVIDLGATPDASDSSKGLDRFKKGFANDYKTNWLCGLIADKVSYQQLLGNEHPQNTQFFPAYRQ